MLGLLLTYSVLLVGLPSRQLPDPHAQMAHAQPFTASTVNARAAGLKFASRSSMEPAAADVMDYFDVAVPPILAQEGPTILGKVTIKAAGLSLSTTNVLLPPGEYYHWVGKNNGLWLAGFSSTDGKNSIPTEVRFVVDVNPSHRHVQTYTHDPDGAAAWQAAVSVSQGPGRQQPPGRGVPPPPPPRIWRCVEIWKSVTNPNTGKPACTITGWVRVPA